MSTRFSRRRGAAAAVATAALVGAALAGTAGQPAVAAGAHHRHHATHSTVVLHGHKTPVVIGSPRQVVGAVPKGAQANLSSAAATFSCQVTDPPTCFGPAQIRKAYGLDQIQGDGTGQTVAIVDAYSAPKLKRDLANFDALFDLPPADLRIFYPGGRTPFDINDANQVGWSAEISLDVEYVHAVAPGATIQLVLSKTNDDAEILKAQKFVVRKGTADVLTQSFGEAEQCEDPAINASTHQLFKQAKQIGMTVFASSGDQGAAQPTCDNTSYFKATSTPASDPFVTGVGGTLLTTQPDGTYVSETTWNEPEYNAAGGGGISTIWERPYYQNAANGRAPMRTVPDVAYNAGIDTGVLVVWSTSGFGRDLVFRFGGTSAGSPQWAAMTALADEQAGHRVGFINPELYALAQDPSSYAADFHDITTGDNTYHGEDVTIPGFPATPGYDLATGLGSPQAQNLVPALVGAPPAQ